MSIFKKIKEHEEAAPATKATLSRSIVSTAFILTILSVAVLAYISTAWFSNNRKIDNTGVHMNIQSSPNMIIADGDQTETAGVLNANSSITGAEFRALTPATADIRVEYTDTGYDGTGDELLLVPVTHSSANNTTYGLTYLQNPSIIDRFTGVKTSDNYNLVEVTSNSNPRYFLEHKVLIASTDGVLPANALTATFSAYNVNGDPDDPNDAALTATDHSSLTATSVNMYQYAASVDFYVKVIQKSAFDGDAEYAESITVTKDDYKGTLNIATKDNVTWNITSTAQGTSKSSVTLLGGENNANISIPWNAAENDNDDCCIVVVMRFYFDGALLWKQTEDDSENPSTFGPDTAYVHSAYLDIASMPNLYVKFEATNPVPVIP